MLHVHVHVCRGSSILFSQMIYNNSSCTNLSRIPCDPGLLMPTCRLNVLFLKNMGNVLKSQCQFHVRCVLMALFHQLKGSVCVHSAAHW